MSAGLKTAKVFPEAARPDFLIKLTNAVTLVLEVKGVDSQQNRTKREFLGEWIKAVNNHGGFGRWEHDVSVDPADVSEILAKRCGQVETTKP